MSLFDYLRGKLQANTERLRDATHRGRRRRELLQERGAIKAGLLGEPHGLRTFEDALRAMRESGTTVDMERAEELREQFERTYPGMSEAIERGRRRRRERLEDCLDGREVPGTARRDEETRERVDEVPEGIDEDVLERRRKLARGDFS